MFCPHCNHFIEYETDRCPYCQNVIQKQGEPAPLPMNWYRFVVTVLLRIEIVLDIIGAGIRLLLAFSPYTSSILSYYNCGFAWNIVMAVVDIACAFWAYRVRIMLAEFKDGASKLYIRYLISTGAFSVAFSLFSGLFVLQLISVCIEVFCNKAYFSKREHLFVH